MFKSSAHNVNISTNLEPKLHYEKLLFFLSIYRMHMTLGVAKSYHYVIKGELVDRGTHKRMNSVKMVAKINNGSQLSKFPMSEMLCNFMYMHVSRGRRLDSRKSFH